MPIPKDPYDNPREFIEDHSDFKDDEEQELYENSHSASLSTKNVDDYLTTYIPGEKIYRPAGVKGYIPPESYYPSLRDTHQEPLKTEVPQPRKQYASQVVNNNPYRTSKYNVKNRKKVSVVLGAILAVILTLPSMFYSSRLNKTLQYIERSTRAISSYDFTEAENSGLEAQKYIEKLRKTPAPVKMFFKLSGSEESELSNTIDALDSIANSQTLLAQNDVLKGIFSEKSPDVLGISNISSNTGDLSSAVSDYEQAISTYDNLESKILKGFLENAGIRDIDIDNIKSLRNISPVLYQILGYEDSQKYLILVQNEKYQSSTGGIAEDYQIVSIENGNIEVTKTGDVSEIDNIIVTLEEPLPAPLPLSKALGEEILTLQNANWEPDIKKNSKDIVYLYEIAMQEKLDGVVYLTTEYRDIFKTAYQYGINPNTADRFKKGLKDKEIIIYNKNNKIQSALALNNWTGEIKEHSDDYLYILDSGLNGKDNESEIISEAEYKVFLPDEERGFLRELKVTYANSGSEDYLNHIRVLVPRNAFLKNAKILSGNVEKNIGKKIQVSLYGNKALYETDLLIEAGSDLEIIFEYESTESFVGENSINFVFQKQPGKPTFPILFYVEYNNDVSNMDFESGVIKVDPNTIKFPVNIDSDKEFNLPL